MNVTRLGFALICVAASCSAAFGATVLIDSNTNNGSFEKAGGVTNTTKIKVWDGTPDIDNWTEWAGVSTANGDSGVEMNTGIATNGVMAAFLQPNNAVYNLTSHIAAAGESYTLSWDHVNQAHTLIGGLVFNNGGTVTSIAATEVTTLNPTNGLGGVYTIPVGSPAIGKAIGVGVRSLNEGYADIDNFVLTVGSVPEPGSLMLLLIGIAAGGLGLSRNRQK